MDWNPAAPEWSAPAAVSKTAPVADEAAPRRSAGLPAVSGGTATPAAQEASNDLWARAVEQSPGVWTVDTGTNTPHYSPSDTPADSAHTLEPQHYAPATAQIPEDPAGPPAPAGPAPDDAANPAGQPQPTPFATAVTAVTAAPAAVAVAAPAPAPVPVHAGAPASNSRQSLYQRLSNSPEAEAGRAKGPVRAAAGAAATMQDIPSADDETIEESGVFGRAAVERILGGKLVEERALDGSPLPPRF